MEVFLKTASSFPIYYCCVYDVCVCLCVLQSAGVGIPQHIYGSQRTTSGNLFFPSTMGSRD